MLKSTQLLFHCGHHYICSHYIAPQYLWLASLCPAHNILIVLQWSFGTIMELYYYALPFSPKRSTFSKFPSSQPNINFPIDIDLLIGNLFWASTSCNHAWPRSHQVLIVSCLILRLRMKTGRKQSQVFMPNIFYVTSTTVQ